MKAIKMLLRRAAQTVLRCKNACAVAFGMAAIGAGQLAQAAAPTFAAPTGAHTAAELSEGFYKAFEDPFKVKIGAAVLIVAIFALFGLYKRIVKVK